MRQGCSRAAPLPAQSIGVGPQGGKLRLAVMDLSGSAMRMQTAQAPMPQGGGQMTQTVAIPPPPEFARSLTEMLTTTLINTQRFVVLERHQLQAVLGEQDFSASGRVNPETAAAQGRVIGAQAMITGDITGYAYSQQAIGGNTLNLIRGLNTNAARVTAQVVIDLRMIDAATGEVLGSASGTGKASATGVAADLTVGDRRLGTGGAWTTPLGNASRQAIDRAVEALLAAMPRVPWSAKIADVRGDAVIINAGSDDGMRPGMILEVYQVDPAVVDPDTGRNLGAPELLLGSIRIESVQPRFATTSVLTGTGFTRGNVVRFKGGE
jgi:curli biogenesis system outer membrane secretion channel CsgG